MVLTYQASELTLRHETSIGAISVIYMNSIPCSLNWTANAPLRLVDASDINYAVCGASMIPFLLLVKIFEARLTPALVLSTPYRRQRLHCPLTFRRT